MRKASSVALAIAAAAAIATAESAHAQVRAGFGGVRSAAPRMGGAGRSVSAPRTGGAFRPISRPATAGRHFSTGGNGLTVNGAVDTGNFRMGLHLGANLNHGHHQDCGPGHDHWGSKPPHCDFPSYPYYPYYPLGWYWYSDGGYAIDGSYSAIDPQLVGYTPRPNPPEEPPPPPTNRELGDYALAVGDTRGAIAAYRAHLASQPNDAQVMRLLALALLEARNVKEGVAVFAMAHRTDPTLASDPLSERVYGFRTGVLRQQVNRVSQYAQNTGSASAWLAMAALTQAQGRRDVASRMIERARAAGLDKAVADQMIAALSA